MNAGKEQTWREAEADRERRLADAKAAIRACRYVPSGATDEQIELWATMLMVGEEQERERLAKLRPTVYRGDVLLTLGHEISIAGQQLRDLTAFRDRVVAAAKDPAAWMLLRQELAS